jgi:hypothetical protein
MDEKEAEIKKRITEKNTRGNMLRRETKKKKERGRSCERNL